MKFIPEKEFELKLRCSKESALNALKMNTRQGEYYVARKYRNKMFWGKFTDNEFELHVFFAYYKPMSIVTGRVEDADKMCNMYLNIRMNIYSKIVLFGSLILYTLLLFLFSLKAIKNGVFNYEIIVMIIFLFHWYFFIILIFKHYIKYTITRIKKMFAMSLIKDQGR